MWQIKSGLHVLCQILQEHQAAHLPSHHRHRHTHHHHHHHGPSPSSSSSSTGHPLVLYSVFPVSVVTHIYIYTICLCLQSSSLDLCVEWSARPVWCGAPTKPTKTASTYMSSYRCFFTHCSSWNEHVPCGTGGGGSTVQTPRCQNMPNYCLWFLKLMYIFLYIRAYETLYLTLVYKV